MLGAALFSALLTVTPVSLDDFATGAFWALAISVLVGELLPLEIPRISGDGEVDDLDDVLVRAVAQAGLVPAIAAQAIASAASGRSRPKAALENRLQHGPVRAHPRRRGCRDRG